MYLAEMPPNVEAAIAFRRRWNLENKRTLMLAVAENHISTTITSRIPRSVVTLMFCRAIIPLCATDLHFQALTGTKRAFFQISVKSLAMR